jgi:hypothetical protein
VEADILRSHSGSKSMTDSSSAFNTNFEVVGVVQCAPTPTCWGSAGRTCTRARRPPAARRCTATGRPRSSS